ncbi:MAG TPA: hypothetical protein VH518_05915 [Tepidisphaeraceae bacterium]
MSERLHVEYASGTRRRLKLPAWKAISIIVLILLTVVSVFVAIVFGLAILASE